MCDACEGQFLSPIFTVPKPNGKHRFILNLKMLNKFIKLEHFKMEDYRTALKLLGENNYMSNLDLKDAYFLVSIDKGDRKLLRFKWESQKYNSQLFEFNVLPFGLCTSPYVYTKLLKPVLQHLRMAGYMSVCYLDDFMCIGDSIRHCLDNVSETIRLLTSLGFIINYEKSNLTPDLRCKFLGFIFDTTSMSLSLPEEKRVRIKTKIEKFLRIRKCSIRQFAEFIGLLTSACPAVKYGWLHTKIFEREKFLALNYSNNYNKTMELADHIKPDLEWWSHNILESNSQFRNNDYLLEIFSDASRSGWGIACGNDTASGHWDSGDLEFHINYLELKAAYYGLKIFGSNLKNCSLLLRIDNTTAISYINRMGGIQFTHLNDITREIWLFCEQRNIFIFASYIKSTDNVVADRESRDLKIDTEWEIADYAFQKIIDALGVPEFDLFASVQNHKCERYASWKLDPCSEVVDAFTFNWKNLNFYAFPPFCLVAKVLQKIIYDKAEGIIVVPVWPSQPWYPLYRKLMVSKEIIFDPNESLLISPFRRVHPLHRDLTLAAVRLSGRR